MPGPPATRRADWKRYPVELFGNPTFTFPQIEGLTSNQTDTWFVYGKLTGARTAREYAFLTIFCKNRVFDFLRADFYTLAIFDARGTAYGTFTEFDFPPASLFSTPRLSITTGHLGLSFASSAGTASWTTQTDDAGNLVPFSYRLDLVGVDAEQRPMALVATMQPQEPPTAVGGELYGGIITHFGQDGTGSYFQTAPAISGTITSAGITEPVTGTIGHIDRQFLPQYAGIYAGLSGRDRSHEWRSIHLSDGSTVSMWFQYNRTTRNALQPFSGATRFVPSTQTTDYDPDVIETITSYVKWPSSVATLLAPQSPNRYLPDAHVLEVPSWGLRLTGFPITPVPAHQLPVEYMNGPVAYRGTLAGRPITGFGVSERTLALYRQWELVEVLRVTVMNLPASAFRPGGTTLPQLRQAVDQLGGEYDSGNTSAAQQIINTQLIPAVATLSAAAQPFLVELLGDILAAPS